MRVSPSLDSDDQWQIALRNQIEEIARRNSGHKKYAQVEDRTKEMDDIVIRLRELYSTNRTEAARLHVQALSILDETDRLIAATMLDATHIKPYMNAIGNARKNCQNSNKIMPEKTVSTVH
ncbi:unnamed protein product [Gongylonema pulchrum]|uniref:PH domain-containing protein n=1 Tax=Gongylonema pulchrum TaxID=637853 RepID=A0A183EUR2_9BILA|nr:unnamed protein product [Gongylonema pulchrum]